MEIVRIKTTNEYKRLVTAFYKEDPFFINNKSGLIDLVCRKNSAFYNHSRQEMIGVLSGGGIACICVLIRHENDLENLMMAFFECRKDSFDEVSFMVDYALAFGKKHGYKNLIAGLDGHCNNSVGFLSSGEGRPSFGQSYNPIFYNDIFRRLCFQEIKLVSYMGEIQKLNLKLFSLSKRMIPAEITISSADFSMTGFRETMRLYTDFNNKIFQNHRYCFPREYDEDYELFAALRWLLDGDNMIFAKAGDKIAGFLFWYPDFNELIPSGGCAGVGTFLKHRVAGQTPAAVKAVQMGVLPEYENSGLILALFGEFHRVAMKKHKNLTVCLSSWILEENQKSVKLSSKVLPHPYKEMSAYEKEI